MADPNIPDDVIEKAVAAHKAPRLHVNDTRHDRIIDMRAAALVIARWAREEALKEAEAAVHALSLTLNDIGYEQQECEEAIRALREGGDRA